MNQENKLLSLIDDRIRKILRKQPSVRKYAGIVVSQIDDSWANVRLSGYDTVFKISNHTGEVLSSGDSVYVEVVNESMSTAMIVQRFDTLSSYETNSGITTHTQQKNIFPVNSVYFSIVEEDPRLYYGGDWVQLGTVSVNTSTNTSITIYAYKRTR